MQKSDFSLRKLKVNNAFSEETLMFMAELFYGDKFVADVKNDGHGGCDDFYATPESRPLLKEVEEWCKKQPKVKSQFGEFDYDIEYLVSELIEAEETKKQLKSFIKKIDKIALKAIVYGKADYSGPIKSVGFRATIAEMLANPAMKEQLRTHYLRAKEKLGNGEVILNKNLDF